MTAMQPMKFFLSVPGSDLQSKSGREDELDQVVAIAEEA